MDEMTKNTDIYGRFTGAIGGNRPMDTEEVLATIAYRALQEHDTETWIDCNQKMYTLFRDNNSDNPFHDIDSYLCWAERFNDRLELEEDGSEL